MTNAEAWFNKSLRPRKPEGSLGRTAQDGHLDSHTTPELCQAGNLPMDIVFVTLFYIAVGTAINCVVLGSLRNAGRTLSLASCCSGGGPRKPWSSGSAPVSRSHSFSVPPFPLVPVPDRPSRLRGR